MTEMQEQDQGPVKSSAKMRWYVVHVYSGMEKSVQRALIERIGRCAFPEQFGEVLVPTEEVVETRNNRRYVSERRMYAGYVLIQMTMNDDTWHLVKNTPRVTGFLGGNRPAALADHEIAAILQTQEATAEKPRPKISFEVGETVRLKEGAFRLTDKIKDGKIVVEGEELAYKIDGDTLTLTVEGVEMPLTKVK